MVANREKMMHSKSISQVMRQMVLVLFFIVGLVLVCDAEIQEAGFEQEMKLSSLVAYASKSMNKIIVPDQDVLEEMEKKQASVIVPAQLKDLPQKDPAAWGRVLARVLSVHGYALVEQGDVIRLVHMKNVDKERIPLVPAGVDELAGEDDDTLVTMVIQLQYVSTEVLHSFAKMVSNVFQPIVSEDKKTITVTGKKGRVQRFGQLARLLDRKPEALVAKTYQLKWLEAVEFKAKVTDYFNGIDKRNKGYHFHPSPRVRLNPENGLEVDIEATPADHQTILELVGIFDIQYGFEGDVQVAPVQDAGPPAPAGAVKEGPKKLIHKAKKTGDVNLEK